MSKIKIQYNGSRFPRVAALQKGKRKTFQPWKRVIEFDMYDAMYLLTSNNRINPLKWEFTIYVTPKKVVAPAADAKQEADNKAKQKADAKAKGGK